MTVLSLHDPAVRSLRLTHPKLKNMRLIGRGNFSKVFSCGDRKTVFKLTTDQYQLGYLLDPKSPQGIYKPRVIEHHGVVGRTRAGYAIWLLELERLSALRPLSANYILAKRIVRFADECPSCCRLPGRADDLSWLQEDLAAYLDQVNAFVDESAGRLDAKICNFMQRRDGTLVLNDPVFDMAALYNELGVA